MKLYSIIFFVIVVICAFYLQKTAAGADPEWTLEDVIAVVRANSSQIKDIQYTYMMQQIPAAEPNYIWNEDVTVMWIPEKNWEKRIVRDFVSSYPNEIYHKEHAWDGEYDRYNIQLTRNGRPGRKEGIISSKKAMFSLLEPLDLLDIKGGSYGNLVLILSGKDVLVEGRESIDGHETVVVSCNRISNLPRKDSLVMKYWLDVKCGVLPRYTEMYHKGELRRVISDVTISEIEPGLFFPTSCKIEPGYKVRTSAGESEDRWSQGSTTCIQIDINSVKVNQGLQKEVFNVEFEYSQPVLNEDIGITYYEGIGPLDMGLSPEKLLDTLDKIVDETFAISGSVDSNSSNRSSP